MAATIARGRVGGIYLVGGLATLAGIGAAFSLLPVSAVPMNALALAAAAAAVALGAGALHQARALRRQTEKVSGELDVLSTRLLRVEARVAEPDRNVASGLTSTVAEVTGEIAVLGGLVRDLAVTVATQDRDVASLKDQVERAKAQASAAPPLAARPAPVLVPVPPVLDLDKRARERRVIPSILPMPEPSEPAPPAPVHDVRPAAEDARRLGAVMEAFEKDRIELHLQPVVSLPQRKSHFYEVLARLRLADDSILVPAEFLPIIERAGLVAELDRKVLTRAAGIARHLAGRGSEARVSCNISPASLDGGILRAAARIAEAYPDVADRLILELSQRCWRGLDADHAGMIVLLRTRGFSFALDRAVDLRLDPLALAERGVGYVKLPAEMLLHPETAGGLDVQVADLATVFARAGIRLVAERVEREEDVPNLIDLDVPFAQGFVFAPPRAIRPEVLAPAAASATAAAPQTAPGPQPAPHAAPAPAAASLDEQERRPFRTFLRRAG